MSVSESDSMTTGTRPRNYSVNTVNALREDFYEHDTENSGGGASAGSNTGPVPNNHCGKCTTVLQIKQKNKKKLRFNSWNP